MCLGLHGLAWVGVSTTVRAVGHTHAGLQLCIALRGVQFRALHGGFRGANGPPRCVCVWRRAGWGMGSAPRVCGCSYVEIWNIPGAKRGIGAFLVWTRLL